MGTIRISKGTTSVMDYILGSVGIRNSSYGYSYNGQKLYFMKGAMPLQSELNAANAYFRQTDQLVTFQPGSGGVSFDDTEGTLTLEYTEAVAAATGTATWWYWDARDVESSTRELLCRLAGTISTVGGGGDLEIPTTSITSGEVYGAGPIILTVPTSWTY